jgi:hypothetical protein
MNLRLILACLLLATPQISQSAIVAGLLSDFEDNTTQGWAGGASPTNIPDGGPTGVGDNSLRIGGGGSLATFNLSSAFSGAISSTVIAFQVDLMRASGDTGNLEIRLTLFSPGTGNRWASTTAAIVPNDGNWNTYTFSLLEADLTQVQGTASYTDLTGAVDRVMFRHDPGAPSAGGSGGTGSLNLDNIRAIPEPTSGILCLAASAVLFRRRR